MSASQRLSRRLPHALSGVFLIISCVCLQGVHQVAASPIKLQQVGDFNTELFSALHFDSASGTLYIGAGGPKGGAGGGPSTDVSILSIAPNGVRTAVATGTDCPGATDITKDSSTGTLYATCNSQDSNSAAVISVDSSGVITALITGGDCFSPTALSFDSSTGNVVVACTAFNGIISISSSGSFTTILPTSYSCGYLQSIWYDSSNSITYAGCDNGLVTIDSAGTITKITSTDSYCSLPSGFVKDSSSGTVYVSCGAGLLSYFQNHPPYSMYAISSGVMTPFLASSPCSYPQSIAYDSVRGKLYAACMVIYSGGLKYGNITEVSIPSGTTRTIADSSVCNYPLAIEFDSATGVIYAICSYGSLAVSFNPCTSAPSAAATIGIDYTNGGASTGTPCSGVAAGSMDGTSCDAACASGYVPTTSGAGKFTCDGSINQWTGLACARACAAAPTSTAFPQFKMNPNGNSNDCSLGAGQHTCNAACDSANGFVQSSAAGTAILTCAADGVTWTTSLTCAPACVLPSASNGIVLTGSSNPCSSYGTNLPISTSCNVACDTNYVLTSGSTTLTCSSSSVLSTLPTCAAPCTLPSAASGMILTGSSNPCSSISGGKLTAGSSCNVACAADYVMSGSSTLTCSTSSVLSATPTCTAPCALPTASNGIVLSGSSNPCSSVSSGNLPAGSTCNVACDTNYVLTSGAGSTTLTCSSSGVLSALPTCAAPCTLPSAANGMVLSGASNPCSSASGGKLTAGSSCDVACATDYVMSSGSATLTCSSSSVLSASPTCTAPCTLPSASNGMVLTGSSSPCSGFSSGNLPAGSNCNVACDTNYVLTAGSTTLTCSSSGVLSALPTCAAPCTLSSASNGMILTGSSNPCSSISGGKLTAGSSCNVACAADYVMSGSSTLTCSTSSVLSATPTCTAPCTLPTASAALVLTSITSSSPCSALSSGKLPAASSCDVSCNTNYVMTAGSSILTCSASGVLSTLPTCILPYADCTAPPATDGFKVDMTKGTCKDVSSTNKLAHGASCTFGCVTGYQMYQPVTCNNGQYSSVPHCVGYPLPGNVWFFGSKV